MWVSYSDLGRDLRPGDKVRIVDERVPGPDGPRWNISGGMNKYLGQVMTVNCVYNYQDPGDCYCDMLEDHGMWAWFHEMFDSVYVPDAVPLDDVSTWQNPSLCSLFD